MSERQEERQRYRTFVPGVGTPLVPVDHSPLAARATKRLGRWFVRSLIVLGAVYAVTWAAAIAAVAAVNTQTPGIDIHARWLQAESGIQPVLEYRLPTDPTIVPEEAGVALQTLGDGVHREPRRTGGAIPRNAASAVPDAPWRAYKRGLSDLFPAALSPNGFLNVKGVIHAARNGLTPEQKRLAEIVATAQAWTVFDYVARAPAIDFLAGEFVLPFGPTVSAWEVDYGSSAATNQYAEASVIRAAWHLGAGRPDSAEFALRSLVSVGALLAETGLTTNERGAGLWQLQIARDALIDLWTVTGDPRGRALWLASARSATHFQLPTAVAGMADASGSELRARLAAIATDRSLAPGQRFVALRALAGTDCGTISGVMFGPSKLVQSAVEQFDREVAHFPSEHALVGMVTGDLVRYLHEGAPSINLYAGSAFSNYIGAVYGRGRLEACAALIAHPMIY